VLVSPRLLPLCQTRESLPPLASSSLCHYPSLILFALSSITPTKLEKSSIIQLLVMPSALILIADGSEKIEFVTPYDGKYPFPLCNHRSDNGLPLSKTKAMS
jgi:hypothetical protein